MSGRGKYPCGWCGERFQTFREVREHGPTCAKLKRRLNNLPFDLEVKVHQGGMKLEAAEREAEQFRKDNPSLKLD